MQFSYNKRYTPPIPTIEVAIGRFSDETLLALTALVDTGADATIIPVQLLRQINSQPHSTAMMRGVAGGRYEVELHRIHLKIGIISLRSLVVADELYDEVILGRDVLNELVIQLNGLQQTLTIEL